MMKTEVTKKYRIYRFINDISINGKEFICEDDGSIKLFDSEDHAKAFLKENKQMAYDIEDKIRAANGLDFEMPKIKVDEVKVDDDNVIDL